MWPCGVHSHALSIVGRVPRATLSPRLAAAFLAVLFAGACSSSPPEVPAGPDGDKDPVLVLGRDVFGARCVNCHGADGGGGIGPPLRGAVVDTFPDPEDQAAVVRDGRNSMPSFTGTLSEAQIDAVVRYTREVLS